MKQDNLIAALKSMLTLQRWNLQPRIETWVEAENAAMVTHLAYAVGKHQGLTPEVLIHLLFRTLLKSLNKHYMSDISFMVKEKLKKEHGEVWREFVDKNSTKTAKLFPRSMAGFLKNYLTDEGNYCDSAADKVLGPASYIDTNTMGTLENIARCCQYKAAIWECENNIKVYTDAYTVLKNNTEVYLGDKNFSTYKENIKEFDKYFRQICSLKSLRRWNTINRFVSSSVLGHTYIVSLLALVLSLLSKPTDYLFCYKAVLRGLFHDVPESMTGDIITPVKKGLLENTVRKIEGDFKQAFKNDAPPGVRGEIDTYHLLDDEEIEDVTSAGSLVKDCDHLALIIECLCEKSAGIESSVIVESYYENYQELSRSQWLPVREFLTIVADHWYHMDHN
jgi:putative hydrolases of HD superfamily